MLAVAGLDWWTGLVDLQITPPQSLLSASATLLEGLGRLWTLHWSIPWLLAVVHEHWRCLVSEIVDAVHGGGVEPAFTAFLLFCDISAFQPLPGMCEVQSHPSPSRNVAEAEKRLCGGVICKSASPIHQFSSAIVYGPLSPYF